MKRCERCGYLKFSKQEKQIIDLLPNNSINIARELNRPFNHINAILFNLKNLKVIKIIGKRKRLNIWGINKI